MNQYTSFNKKKCIVCNTNKYYTKVGAFATEYPDDVSKVWKKPNVCGECVPKVKSYNYTASYKKASEVGELELKQCKCCLVTKPRTYHGKTKFNSSIYRADDGRLWHGQVCPDCYAKKVAEQRRLEKIDLPEKECKCCGKSFIPKRNTKVFCSDLCRSKYKSKSNRANRPILEKVCLSCGSSFTTLAINKKYCSTECSKKKKPTDASILITKVCPTCIANFVTTNKTKAYCNQKHQPNIIKHKKKLRC